MCIRDSPLPVPALVEILKAQGIAAERKGIYRDIAALRQYGADIRKGPGGYYLESRPFSGEEVWLIAQAIQAAPFLSPFRIQDLLERLLPLLLCEQDAQKACAREIYGPKAENDQLFRCV